MEIRGIESSLGYLFTSEKAPKQFLLSKKTTNLED